MAATRPGPLREAPAVAPKDTDGHGAQNTMANYRVVLSPDEDDGVIAKCVEISGAISEGDDEEEAVRNVTEAIEGCLDIMGQLRPFNLTIIRE